jgi:hypothetical protein
MLSGECHHDISLVALKIRVTEAKYPEVAMAYQGREAKELATKKS